MAAAVLIGALTVPLAGGRLVALGEIRFRHGSALGAALGLQIAIISVFPTIAEPVAEAVHLGSYLLAAVFLWGNRRLVGLWVAAVGAGCNVAAISANGGVMPASESALRRAGLPTESAEFENSAVVDDARLQFLGDIFAVPDGWPLANVFSVGDVLIVVGIAVTLHAVCGSRLAGGSRPGSDAEPAPSVSG